jgi:hypothetical protein
MMPDRPFSLFGADLSTARRARAVALVVDSATDDLHEVRTLLPDRVDMLTVLDEIGWPGAHEGQTALAPAAVQVLEAVVYATLILALEEGETSAYRPCGRPPGPPPSIRRRSSRSSRWPGWRCGCAHLPRSSRRLGPPRSPRSAIR